MISVVSVHRWPNLFLWAAGEATDHVARAQPGKATYLGAGRKQRQGKGLQGRSTFPSRDPNDPTPLTVAVYSSHPVGALKLGMLA